jgi:hypothetical protein
LVQTSSIAKSRTGLKTVPDGMVADRIGFAPGA